MRNLNKSQNNRLVKAMLIAFAAVSFYIFSLMLTIYVCSLNYSNRNDELCIEIGFIQGRRQVLDSLNNTQNYGINTFEYARKKAHGFRANGTIYTTNAH